MDGSWDVNTGRHYFLILDVSHAMNTGPERVLHMLCNQSKIQRLKVLMLLWRIWFVRNMVVHGKVAPAVELPKYFFVAMFLR